MMPKVDRCELCGIDFIDGQERGKFIAAGRLRSGRLWLTGRFPEIADGTVIECHPGCAEGLQAVDLAEGAS